VRRILNSSLIAVAVAIAIAYTLGWKPTSAAANLPDPKVDESPATASGRQTVVLAGGCFWGTQVVFEHVKGVTKATAGYSGGRVKDPSYEQVSSGETGHAESVEVVYDPSKITFGQRFPSRMQAASASPFIRARAASRSPPI
jgi:peptide-methionine (S)-S-oxide reductase